MSLVNEYLRKTEADSPTLSSSGVVPPSLTGGYRRPVRKSSGRFLWYALAIGVTAIVVFLVTPWIRDTATTPPPMEMAAAGKSEPLMTAPRPAETEQAVAKAPAVAPAAAQMATETPAADRQPEESARMNQATAATQVPARQAVTAPAATQPTAPPSGIRETDLGQSDLPPAEQIVAVSSAYASPPPAEQRPVASYSAPPMDGFAPSAVSVSSREMGQPESSKPAQTVASVKASSRAKPEAAASDPEKFYQLGLAAYQGGNLNQAEEFYLQGLRQTPNSEKLLTNLSAVYLEQGKLPDAGQTLERARRLNPRNANVLVNLGILELRQGRESQAKSWFSQAIQINPADERALINLAYLAQKAGDVRQVEDYYSRILRNSPSNLDVRLAYASLLEKRDQFAEAISEYQACLELDKVQSDSRLQGQIRNRIRLLSRYTAVSQSAGDAR